MLDSIDMQNLTSKYFYLELRKIDKYGRFKSVWNFELLTTLEAIFYPFCIAPNIRYFKLKFYRLLNYNIIYI
jgi:hypothetical protein